MQTIKKSYSNQSSTSHICALFGSLSLRVTPIEMIKGPAFSAIETEPEPAFVAPPTFAAAIDRSLAFLTGALQLNILVLLV